MFNIYLYLVLVILVLRLVETLVAHHARRIRGTDTEREEED